MNEDFYVGQVLEMQDEGSMASISFMSKVRNKNVFVWPEVEDIASVEAKFVFFWDVQLSSTNGRTWLGEDVDDIMQSYKLYKDRFCWYCLLLYQSVAIVIPVLGQIAYHDSWDWVWFFFF